MKNIFKFLLLILILSVLLIVLSVNKQTDLSEQRINLQDEDSVVEKKEVRESKVGEIRSSILQNTRIENPSSVTLVVQDKLFKVQIEKDNSVYDVMVSLIEKGFIFESRLYSGLGRLITSINGIKNDELGGRYWTLYVNNKKSNLGASGVLLNRSDVIEWRFEKESEVE